MAPALGYAVRMLSKCLSCLGLKIPRWGLTIGMRVPSTCIPESRSELDKEPLLVRRRKCDAMSIRTLASSAQFIAITPVYGPALVNAIIDRSATQESRRE